MKTVTGPAPMDLRLHPDEGFYEVPGVCLNCGWAGPLLIDMGKPAPRRGISPVNYQHERCQKCGCKSLVRTEWAS